MNGSMVRGLAIAALLIAGTAAAPAGQQSSATGASQDLLADRPWLDLFDRVGRELESLQNERSTEAFSKLLNGRTTEPITDANDLTSLSFRTCTVMAAGAEATFAILADRQSDRSVLFGLPTDTERKQVAIGALEVIRAMAGVAGVLPMRITQAERLPESERTPETEAQLVKAIHQRDTQFPLRAARACLLLASLVNDQPLRKDLLARAAETASKAETPSPWAKSEQAVLQGLAALMSDDAPATIRFFATAKEAANAADAPPEVAGAIAPDLALGAALATRRLKDTASALAAIDRAEAAGVFKDFGDRNLDLSIVAAEARLRLARTAENEAAKAVAEAAAYNAFRSIIDSRDFAEPVTTRRDAVIEHLGPIVPAESPASLPAVPLVARAVWLLSTDNPGDALPLLELAVTKSDSDLGTLKITALDRLARALQRDGASPDELTRAADLFLSIARDHSDDPDAPGAALRACATTERLWHASKPNPTPDLRAKVFATFRFAIDSPLDVPHRDDLRATCISLLTANLDSAGAVRAIQQVREAERLSGSLINNPTLSSIARLDLARGWLQLAAIYPGHEEAFTDQELNGEQATKNARSQAWTAWRAAEQAPSNESPALLRKAAALEALAFLQLNDPKQAFERLQSIPAFDLSTEENTDLLSIGARVLAVRGDIDPAREWISRLETLSPELARAAMTTLSRDAWLKLTPMTSGFAADTQPDRVSPEPVAALRFAAEWDGWPNDTNRREHDRRRAWSLVLTNEADHAADIFHKLIDDSAPTPPTPDLLRGLAEADLRAGRDEPAFTGLKRLAADLESKRDYTRDYWHAWTRMIEILNRQNTDGSRTPVIRREVARLELLPSAQHQSDCLQRLKAIRDKLPNPPESSAQ